MFFTIRSLVRLPALLCALGLGWVSVTSAAGSMGQWRELAPLPDPIGFSGMFAGVIQDQLIVGGGAQWNQPNWMGGEKRYSDKIWALSSPEGEWRELSLRLPVSSAHFASAADTSGITLAGGLGEKGFLQTVYGLRPDGTESQWVRLTDLPAPVGYACASIVDGRFYVIGGLSSPSSKTPLREVWSLALDRTEGGGEWRREADLPGPGVFLPSAASIEEALYVFGGMATDATGDFYPSSRVYALNTHTGHWRELAALPEPRVGPLSPAPQLSDGRILIAGGYTKLFGGSSRDHPGFAARTFFYHPTSDTWSDGLVLPHAPVVDRDFPGDAGPAPMLGAPGIVWQEQIFAISGEVRASVRSPQVLVLPFTQLISK